MRTGVFGGTFNPVHNGHIHLARTYFDALRLDRMLVIPTCLPPHKPGEQLADGADRLAMCRLAFDGLPRLRGERHRAAARAEKLHGGHPRAACKGIPGRRLLPHHGQRHVPDADRVAGVEAHLRAGGYLRRGAGHRAARPARRLQTLARGAGGARELVELNPLPISSTLVRARAREKKPLGGLVPPEVAAYIDSHGLYQTL